MSLPPSNPPSTPPSMPATASTATKGEVRDAVDHALDLLDKGEARVAEREAAATGRSISG